MALTLSNAVDDVRQVLNEPTAVFWSDAEIEDWIKEGVRVIASKAKAVEADDDLTLVTNQLIYTSSDHAWIADCLALYAAIYDDGANKYKGLIEVHPKQIGNLLTFTAGDPKYFCLHNRSIYIWPLPNSDTNTNTVSFLYAKESEDITELKDEFQHMAIQWAIMRAKEKDQKYAEATAIRSWFYSELQFETDDKHFRTTESANDVKIGKPKRGQTSGGRR
jgi:hypothetical protein